MNKQKYIRLCQDEPSIPLYLQDWWLDCVCGAKLWEVLLYENDKGELLAAMPVYIPCKGVISMPPFTQSMGIWFRPAFEKEQPSKEVQRRQMITEYLIRQLPATHSFLVGFNTKFTDWLPFYWAGYKQTTRYTYLLPDISDAERLQQKWGSDVKRAIQKAQKKYSITIQRDVPVEVFLSLYAMVYERQNKKVICPQELKKIIELALKREQGAIWGAYDAEKKWHAAVFFIWQSDRVYYIASGSDPAFRDSGAPTAVLWQAIQDVSEHATVFDFCGSMIPGVTYFVQKFGAVQTPYFVISKGEMNAWLRLKARFNKMRKNFKKNS